MNLRLRDCDIGGDSIDLTMAGSGAGEAFALPTLRETGETAERVRIMATSLDHVYFNFSVGAASSSPSSITSFWMGNFSDAYIFRVAGRTHINVQKSTVGAARLNVVPLNDHARNVHHDRDLDLDIGGDAVHQIISGATSLALPTLHSNGEIARRILINVSSGNPVDTWFTLSVGAETALVATACHMSRNGTASGGRVVRSQGYTHINIDADGTSLMSICPLEN